MSNILRVIELAKKQGVSLASLCKKIGKTRTYLSEIQTRNRSVPQEYIPALAEALHTTPAYLMGETDDPGIKKEPAQVGRLDGKQGEIMEILGALSEDQLDLVLERCRTLAALNQQQKR